MLKCFEVIGVPSRKQLFSISYVLDGGESFFLKKKNKLLDRKIKAKKNQTNNQEAKKAASWIHLEVYSQDCRNQNTWPTCSRLREQIVRMTTSCQIQKYCWN